MSGIFSDDTFENFKTCLGKPVVDFTPSEGIKDPEGCVYRLRSYCEDHDEESLEVLLNSFGNDPRVSAVRELLIGAWEDGGATAEEENIYQSLVRNAPKMPRLKLLFVGDIADEENMISWIMQGNITPVIHAFPGLEVFGVRGAELSFEALSHKRLKTLVVQSGGLLPDAVEELVAADLPALEHLEMWLGTEEYGGGASPNELAPLLRGECFPSLRYLGLRNADFTDDIIQALAEIPEDAPSILDRIEVLDLSLGTLSNEGARSLLGIARLKNLKKLILDHHYVTDEVVVAQLQELGPEVSLDEVKEEDYGERYVSIGE